MGPAPFTSYLICPLPPLYIPAALPWVSKYGDFQNRNGQLSVLSNKRSSSSFALLLGVSCCFSGLGRCSVFRTWPCWHIYSRMSNAEDSAGAQANQVLPDFAPPRFISHSDISFYFKSGLLRTRTGDTSVRSLPDFTEHTLLWGRWTAHRF